MGELTIIDRHELLNYAINFPDLYKVYAYTDGTHEVSSAFARYFYEPTDLHLAVFLAQWTGKVIERS